VDTDSQNKHTTQHSTAQHKHSHKTHTRQHTQHTQHTSEHTQHFQNFYEQCENLKTGKHSVRVCVTVKVQKITAL
jgi:NADH:ubiquinone oxidoreductase subunit E